MPTQVQMRGAAQATQEVRTLISREIDVNTTDKRISVHDGSTPGGIQHANSFDVQNGTFTYATGSGTNAITASLQVAPTLTAGLSVIIEPANNNTGATTLNLNSSGAKNILKDDGNGTLVALTANNIKSSIPFVADYDGTQFILRQGGSGSRQVASRTVTASSAEDFDDVFTPGKADIIKLSNITASVDNLDILMQLSNDGGGSFNSGSNYVYSLNGWDSSGSSQNKSSTSATSFLIINAIGNGTDEAGTATVNLNDPSSSTAYTNILTHSGSVTSSGGSRNQNGYQFFTDFKNVDSIRFLTNSGTFSGTITIFEEDL